MKTFRVEIHTASTHWEVADCFIEAESKEEARKLFEKDPWAFDWDGWDTLDSELQTYEIDSIQEVDKDE